LDEAEANGEGLWVCPRSELAEVAVVVWTGEAATEEAHTCGGFGDGSEDVESEAAGV
jgi:hypothetical protein